MSAIDELCPHCGLCCDSTLFADVELRPGDDPAELARFGLSVARKGRTKRAFAQPCGCFDGKFCQIYSNRPKRCRMFECGLLVKVAAGRMDAGTALAKISQARGLAARVRRLLKLLGEPQRNVALVQCYAKAMERSIDLADENDAELRGQLMIAFGELMQFVQRDFLRTK